MKVSYETEVSLLANGKEEQWSRITTIEYCCEEIKDACEGAIDFLNENHRSGHGKLCIDITEYQTDSYPTTYSSVIGEARYCPKCGQPIVATEVKRTRRRERIVPQKRTVVEDVRVWEVCE